MTVCYSRGKLRKIGLFAAATKPAQLSEEAVRTDGSSEKEGTIGLFLGGGDGDSRILGGTGDVRPFLRGGGESV